MQSGTKKVLALVLTITSTIFIGSYFYYGEINRAEDPRILPAKALFQRYDKELKSDEYLQALSLLDRALAIYREVPGYESSFEVGVMLNNKATVYLVELETILLTSKEMEKEAMSNSLRAAAEHTRQAIGIYEKWLSDMGKLTKGDVEERIRPFFRSDDPAFAGKDVEKLLAKRVNDLLEAQSETPRRLSVSLTNMGVINRYLGDLEAAKQNYEKAIALWDRNYTAQDNLNTLLNRPVKKRSMLSKLFPPERIE